MPHEPKKRHSTQRQGKRRASIKLQTQKGAICPNCGNVIMPHMVCKFCGFYKGRELVVRKQKTKELKK